VKGFGGPFKMETYDKLSQHQKCVMAYPALMVPEDTSLATSMKKTDKKCLTI
jgi:hypothetical protein